MIAYVKTNIKIYAHVYTIHLLYGHDLHKYRNCVLILEPKIKCSLLNLSKDIKATGHSEICL